ncbi:putative signal transducing protein [Pedobacter antarcticus]|uniref:DUF2007 domain-containing protein n=2 Tax=Pedobacter antarcticus TaxID=34086 RepID=A0A081PGA0_9SPHI|nr:DUF2007 domain-containing protein [Pedobacter antarcticus]KEQ29723.1 hypothetical protein N180_05590 [Pedobacter antarcticus 4BY]SDM77426.1 Putative signal transducing protein [Pedobacter antarcticus]SFE70674.1 Putative signal transducing protein [Pedobacter antarcticus]
MDNNWVKVFTSGNALEAEIVKQGLIAIDIPAVVLNKKDSSYQAFGLAEVLVNEVDSAAAEAYILSIETE